MRGCYCGEKFVSVDETCTTLVGYLRTADHDHDDNCLHVTYRCASGHTESVTVRRTCPNPSCDWKGKEKCFCHKGTKAEGYPRPSRRDTPGDIPDTKRCEHCRDLDLDGHKCDPRRDKRIPYRERRKLIRAEEEAKGKQVYTWAGVAPYTPLDVSKEPFRIKLITPENPVNETDTANEDVKFDWELTVGEPRFYISEDALEELEILMEEAAAAKEKKGE